MNVEYTGRQTAVTKKLKAQAEAGLGGIAKLLGRAASAHVILTADKYRQIAEVTVTCRGLDLVARCESTEMTTALHDALAKIEQQAVRHKQKSTTQSRHPKVLGVKQVGEAAGVGSALILGAKKSAATNGASNGPAMGLKTVGRKAVPVAVRTYVSGKVTAEPHVVRSMDGVAERPMSLEEAVKEAEAGDRGVFVFRDLAGQAMVLHARRDGKMELIEVP